MLESFLIVLGVIFLSIVGYYFFVFSMRDDRAEKRLEHYSDPWDKVSGQTETQPPKNDHRQKAESRFVCCNGGSCHFDPIPFGHFMGGAINEQL
jgi:hypothetical protein